MIDQIITEAEKATIPTSNDAADQTTPDPSRSALSAAVPSELPSELSSVERMCELMGVSRSGWYAHCRRREQGPGPREARRLDLAVKIKVAHDASDGVYGAPRITADLREAGEKVSVKTVAKIMRTEQRRGISPRPWHPITTIAAGLSHLPDLVERRFDQGALNLVWTSDITYLDTDEGWLYLAAVRDGHSRRVLGYDFSESLHTDVVETALRRAVMFRDPQLGDHGVIFHADRGCQYTSAQLADAADELGVRLSVGRTGVCWDNAQQESFWSTLKTEFYNRYHFATRAEAITAVTEWIETVYNRRRRHSALGMTPPVTFEQHYQNTATKAA